MEEMENENTQESGTEEDNGPPEESADEAEPEDDENGTDGEGFDNGIEESDNKKAYFDNKMGESGTEERE